MFKHVSTWLKESDTLHVMYIVYGNYGIRVKDGHTVEQGIMGNTAIVGVRFVKVKQGIVI